MRTPKWLLSVASITLLQFGAVSSLLAADYTASDIALTPGSNVHALNLAWTTDNIQKGSCAVQITQKGSKFNESTTFTGMKTTVEAGKGVKDLKEYAYCSVTVSGLKSDQEYAYHLGDNSGNWGDTYQYSTENSDQYGFVYLADAQIGASMGRRPTDEKKAQAVVDDTNKWSKSLATIVNKFPDAAFIMSAGDQIETPGHESQWSGFFAPKELTSIPLAPTPAAHDELGSSGRGGVVTSYAFDYHFNLPNESEHPIMLGDINECPPADAPVRPGEKPCEPKLAKSEAAAGDYYFTYGDALYIVLNMDSENYELHDAFIQSAIKSNPDAKWSIAMWHYTIYTAAQRSPFIDREIMGAMMEENGIDLVLQGHDHTYCRTHPMLDGIAKMDVLNEKGESVNPAGVVYLTANSASGSKYYKLNPEANTLNFVAVSNQENVPTFSYIDVDANSLNITTYKTQSMDIIDSYTMIKK